MHMLDIFAYNMKYTCVKRLTTSVSESENVIRSYTMLCINTFILYIENYHKISTLILLRAEIASFMNSAMRKISVL